MSPAVRRRAYHHGRIEAARSPIERVWVAFDYVRAQLKKTTDPQVRDEYADRIAAGLVAFADGIPVAMRGDRK